MISVLVLSSHNTELCHLQHGYKNRSAGIFKYIDIYEKVKKNNLLQNIKVLMVRSEIKE